jgi:alkaline phosphatase D
MKRSRPPRDGVQFYGMPKADAKTRALAASLHDLTGSSLWSIEVPPVA